MGQCLAGSLTGAVASERVTGGAQRFPRLNGNQPKSVKAEGSLTARPTSRAGTKVGLSDPTVPSGMAHGLTDKSYPGDNRLVTSKSSISTTRLGTSMSAHRILGWIRVKGWAVRPLKRYVSWVQTVVRQVGLYPLGVGI